MSWDDAMQPPPLSASYGKTEGEPVTNPAAPALGRAEALAQAAAFVAEHVDKPAPTNSRGYAVDGYKAPSAGERLALIERVARFLLGEVTE